ncbi:hypothetical protein OXX59_003735 [Metschnikowia pulcherrima]
MELHKVSFMLASFAVILAYGNECSLLQEHEGLIAPSGTRITHLGPNLNADQLSGQSDTYEEMSISKSSEDECNQKRMEYNLRNRIQQFSRTLKSYIHENLFDVRGFEKQGYMSAHEISEIMALHTMIKPGNSELNDQISMARFMFQIMSESIEPLKYHECVSTAGHSLLWSAIDLDVRLLRLFNTHGEPDIAADGFAIKVFLHQKELNRLRNSFKSVSLAPYGTSVMFHKRISHIADMLEFLSMGLTQEST